MSSKYCPWQSSVYMSQKFPEILMQKRSLLPSASEETEAQGDVSSWGSHSTDSVNRI